MVLWFTQFDDEPIIVNGGKRIIRNDTAEYVMKRTESEWLWASNKDCTGFIYVGY